jgi:hypothetical protein
MKAEAGRADAERTRRDTADQREGDVRRAMREEVEVATEMLRTEAATTARPPDGTARPTRRSRARSKPSRRRT